MFSFEREFKFQNLRIIKFNHNISFIRDNALFSSFQEPFFFHQFERVKLSCWFVSGQENFRKSSRTYTFYDVKIAEFAGHHPGHPDNGGLRRHIVHETGRALGHRATDGNFMEPFDLFWGRKLAKAMCRSGG